VIELEHPRFGRIGGPLKGTGLPIRFSGLEPVGGRPAPTLGEHTTEVLGELGLTASDLASLAERGVI
jgi:crotonobetainyl-CoA:carnitine CoA-transferase CaiB-like acyl-CoA transferase